MQIDNENQFSTNGKIAPDTRSATEMANASASVADTSIQPSVAAEVSANNSVPTAELSPSSAALSVPALEFAFDDEIREQIKPGATTYDDTPVLSGSAEVGAIVMIYDGDQVLGSVQAVAGPFGGVWNFPVPTPLIAGDHVLTVTATGSDGVESAHSDPFAITINDGLRPANIDKAYDDEGEFPKSVADGGVARDTTPLLSGSGESGAIVSIYDGDTLLGTAVVQSLPGAAPGGLGIWNFTSPELAVGEHVFTVTIKDGVDGVESPRSAPYTVNVEIAPTPTAPSIDSAFDGFGPVVGPVENGGQTDDRRPNLYGRGEPGATVTISYGDQVLGTAKVQVDGRWSYRVPSNEALDDGTYTFVATQQIDNSQASEPSLPYQIEVASDVVPLLPPTIESIIDDVGNTGDGKIAVGNNGRTDDATPELQGRGVAGATVTISYGDQVLGTAQVQADGRWTYQVPADAPLADGDYAFVAAQVGIDGQSSAPSAPYVITVLTDVPVVPAPTAPSIDSVSDNAGSSTGIVGKGDRTDDTTPELRGRGQPGALITISYGDEVLGTVQVTASGSWLYRVPANAALDDGTYTFVATQQIDNGPTSEPSLPYQIEVNTAPWSPMIESIVDNEANLGGGDIAIGKGGRTDDATPELQGRGVAGATVTISYGDQVLGTAQVDAKGRWSYQVPADAPLGDDTYTFVATQQIGDGRASLPSAPYQIEVAANAPAPAPTINQVIDDIGNPGDGRVVVHSGQQTDDATPKLWGGAQPGATVTISYGDQVLGTAKADGFGRWEYQVPADAPLANGEYAFVAAQVGINGLPSAPSEPYVVTVLTEMASTQEPSDPSLAPPVILSVWDDEGPITGEVGNGGGTDDFSVLIRGTGEPGAYVSISPGNGGNGGWLGVINIPVQPDGTWSHQLGNYLSVGVNTLTVQQYLDGAKSDWSEPYVVHLRPDPSAIQSVLDVEAPLNLDALVSAQPEAEQPAMAKLTLDDVLTTQTMELFAEAATPVADATALIEIHDLVAEGAWDAPVELASPTDLGGVEYSTQQTALVDQLVQDQIVTV